MLVARSAVSSVVKAVLLLATTACLSSLASTQSAESGLSRTEAAKRRVDEIMKETHRRGEGSINGIPTYTRLPPSPEAVKELRDLGTSAIRTLTDYAFTGTPTQQSMAIDFLGRIGGKEVVPSLDLILQRSPSASNRELALRWLPYEGDDKLRLILLRTAKTDPEKRVRDLAESRLAEFSAK